MKELQQQIENFMNVLRAIESSTTLAYLQNDYGDNDDIVLDDLEKIEDTLLNIKCEIKALKAQMINFKNTTQTYKK